MDLDQKLTELIPKNMAERGRITIDALLAPIKDVLNRRKFPKKAMSEMQVDMMIRLLSSMDTDKDPDAARVLSSPEQSTYGFKKGSTSIEVITKNKTFKAKAEHAKGDPWLPETEMTDDEVKDKFRSFASRVAESSLRWRKRIEETIQKTYDMEKVDSISELTELLAP